MFDAYTADLDREGDSKLFDLTRVPDLGLGVSVRDDYDCPREVCWAADLALPSFVVDCICIAIRGVSALTNHPAVGPRFGALEATLATRNECISTLELQVASKDTEIAAKRTQLSDLEGCIKNAEGGCRLCMQLFASSKQS